MLLLTERKQTRVQLSRLWPSHSHVTQPRCVSEFTGMRSAQQQDGCHLPYAINYSLSKNNMIGFA